MLKMTEKLISQSVPQVIVGISQSFHLRNSKHIMILEDFNCGFFKWDNMRIPMATIICLGHATHQLTSTNIQLNARRMNQNLNHARQQNTAWNPKVSNTWAYHWMVVIVSQVNLTCSPLSERRVCLSSFVDWEAIKQETGILSINYLVVCMGKSLDAYQETVEKIGKGAQQICTS